MMKAERRLKIYLADPEKYWVEPKTYGTQHYYEVIEAKKGVIDKIQTRTIDNALERGIITLEQLKRSREL